MMRHGHGRPGTRLLKPRTIQWNTYIAESDITTLDQYPGSNGRGQLKNPDECINTERDIACRYTKDLAGTPGVTCPQVAGHASSIFWTYNILVNETDYGNSRISMRKLREVHIQTRPF